MKSGAKFGIAAANCMTTQATPLGAAPMYRACSAAVTRGCSGGNAAFTPQERAANSRAATMPAVPTPPCLSPMGRAARHAHYVATARQHQQVRWVPGAFAGGGFRHNNNTAMASGRQPPPPPPPRFGGGGGRGGSWGGYAGGRGHAGPGPATGAYFANGWANTPLPPPPQAMAGMGGNGPPPAAVAPPPSSATTPPN